MMLEVISRSRGFVRRVNPDFARLPTPLALRWSSAGGFHNKKVVAFSAASDGGLRGRIRPWGVPLGWNHTSVPTSDYPL